MRVSSALDELCRRLAVKVIPPPKLEPPSSEFGEFLKTLSWYRDHHGKEAVKGEIENALFFAGEARNFLDREERRIFRNLDLVERGGAPLSRP